MYRAVIAITLPLMEQVSINKVKKWVNRAKQKFKIIV